MPLIRLTAIAALLALAPAADASDRVAGEIATFESPGGIQERCVIVARAPGGTYSAEDGQAERALCSIDFYAADIALCPQIWDERPATIVYRMPGLPQPGDAKPFEHSVCVRGREARDVVSAELAVYTQSVNGGKAPLSFAPSALLYYHLSRYFDTDVQVPVAVFRTMDRRIHRNRVSKRGGALTVGNPALRTLRASWSRLTKVEARPEAYVPIGQLFTSDGAQIHGAMQLPRPENAAEATRAAFAASAPLRALHLDKPSTAAAHEILAEVRRDSARAGPHADPSIVQLLFWMKESSEIVLLDFLLDQRERDDNLELEAAWVWIDGDRLRWRAARTAEIPADLAAQRPLSLRRSWLRDNHALGLARGGDVTPPGDALAQLRHLHPDTFRRLLAFDRELRSGGPLRDWLAEGFGLSDAQVAGIARRAQTAAGHLAAACRAGGLRFDLDPEGFLVEKKVEPRAMNCPDP